MEYIKPGAVIGLRIALVLSLWIVGQPQASAQRLITMSNKCVERVDNGKAALETKNYQDAINWFNEVLDKCSAKDGKEAGNVGLAMAYNSMGQYQEAINHANAALEVSKNTNINAFFARATAYNGLKQTAEAEADFQQIVALTAKNENVKDRATIFAELADLSRQQGMYDKADLYLKEAIALDGENPAFFIQKGDMLRDQGDLDAALQQYELAEANGYDGLEVAQIKVSALINAMEKKYGTNKSNELKAKMTAQETEKVCAEVNRAFELGMKDMQLDLFRAMVCP